MRKFMNLAAIAGALALTACGGDSVPQDDAAESTQPAEASQAEEAPATDVAAPAAEETAEAVTVAQPTSAAATSAAPAIFAQCKACHNVAPGKNGIGPSLAGVFGAAAGHVGDYTYSTPMKSSGLTWDAATLDKYLKSPRDIVPGTKMSYPGLKDDAKRAEVIEYLKTI